MGVNADLVLASSLPGMIIGVVLTVVLVLLLTKLRERAEIRKAAKRKKREFSSREKQEDNLRNYSADSYPREK